MAFDVLQLLMKQGIEDLRRGRLESAEKLFRDTIKAKPDHAAAMHMLGLICRETARLPQAVDWMTKSGELDPTHAEWFVNLAETSLALSQTEKGIASFRRAHDLAPQDRKISTALGKALLLARRGAEALPFLQQTAADNPTDPEAHANIGLAFIEMDDDESAAASFRRAQQVAPTIAKYPAMLGNTLVRYGHPAEALAPLEAAMRLDPSSARLDYAMALLMLGRFAEGWKEFESRPLGEKIARYGARSWHGEPTGSILLVAEQGYGDAIQFIRYVPMVAARVPRVVISCRKEVGRLFRGVNGVTQVHVGEGPPLCESVQSLMGLPRIFGTELNNIPADVPYIHADPDLAKAWNEKLSAKVRPGMRVGLAWAGRPTHPNDRHRSLRLSQLAPLMDTPGVSFVSLQIGKAAAEISQTALPLTDLTDGLTDFADTAALVANLDLVICVDTSIAHLAGAMAKKVWTLLPHRPDWRWLLDRDDSPWYATMRLFRQSRLGDWATVIARVKEALAKEARPR